MISVALLIGASICSLWMCGCSEGDAAEPVDRADVVIIDAGLAAAALDRAPVEFAHDMHTDVMKELDEDCTMCHPTGEDGGLSLLYMRPAGSDSLDKDALKTIYHDNCIACHKKHADAGRRSGPEACGECHRTKREYTSSWCAIGFDKSLHYRHIKARSEKCEDCHHQYDEEQNKLTYVKGAEASCRDCHRERKVDRAEPFRLAAHSACIACHRKVALAGDGGPAGPVSCGGCHDGQRQAAITVVADPPRLKRGQPDFVLLSAPAADLEASKLNTVPFSHIDHERATTTCRGCHHETLKKCNDCHTLWGHADAAGTTLREAMHSLRSNHSCAGCHNQRKAEIACAGCHDLMEQGRLTEHACKVCHTGPPPQDLESERSRYTSLDQFRPSSEDLNLSFAESEIPDTVVIGRLAKDYGPVKMPHGKIVRKLREHIDGSRLAKYFHGDEAVECQGCHHHGSIGRKPALCENCHREPFNTANLFRPGLYGAYHRQCLGCHASMDIQAESDCGVCHKEDQKTQMGMTSRENGRGPRGLDNARRVGSEQ